MTRSEGRKRGEEMRGGKTRKGSRGKKGAIIKKCKESLRERSVQAGGATGPAAGPRSADLDT